jgi:hypothetical protein
MAGKSVPKAAKTKRSISTTKAKPWDPNSERQWTDDKAAGGAAWALRFIELARAKPADYSLEGWIDDAEKLFKGNRDELHAFYVTLQTACLIPVGHTERNPILFSDSFDESLNRAQQFAAFLQAYAEGEKDCMLDGEVEGAAMAHELLSNALLSLNHMRDAETAEAQVTA